MSYIRLPSLIKIPTLRRRGDIRLSIERKEKKRYLTIKLGVLFLVAFYSFCYITTYCDLSMTSLSSVAKLINKWFQKDYTNPLPVLSGFGAFLVGFVLKEMRSTIELFVRKKDPNFNLGEIFLTAFIGIIGTETFIHFLPKGIGEYYFNSRNCFYYR